jgi:hypothetical protein
MKGAKLEQKDYRDWNLKRALIYADPPYVSTTKLHQDGEFDTPEFWLWAGRMVREKNTVIVSEYRAPKEWVMIWQEGAHYAGTLKPLGRKERLFVHRTQVRNVEAGRIPLL